jgi:osmoprotectant transport system permease protein
MKRYFAIAAVLLLLAFVPFSYEQAGLRVGSKAFTEQVILGEMLAHLSRDFGVEPAHFQQIGGTRLVYEELLNGGIDIYPEYTGTISEEILAGQPIDDVEQMRAALAEQGVLMSAPLGFNNTYAFGMKKETAEQFGIKSISDLAKRPDLKFGFSSEWMERKKDGWPKLRDHYGLSPRDVKGMDHDLAYLQLDTGGIDVMDVYSTDAKIKQYDIAILEDDREFFPRYEAVLLYRADLAELQPKLVQRLLQLEQHIDDAAMMKMNAKATLARVPETHVAADFLLDQFNIAKRVKDETLASRVGKHTIEHLDLVRKSLVPAILVAIPLGVIAAKRRKTGQVILALVGIVQTIPALALLVILMKPVSYVGLSTIGEGSFNAVIALFLYSLLPIVRNTYAGLHDIPSNYHESALALGLPTGSRLRLIELPLASRTILAGIKTAAVINVGFATLGALVGAGGYGQPILTGIRLSNNGLILQGAVAAAVMALAVQGLFEFAERYLVPRGLRLQKSNNN